MKNNSLKDAVNAYGLPFVAAGIVIVTTANTFEFVANGAKKIVNAADDARRDIKNGVPVKRIKQKFSKKNAK